MLAGYSNVKEQDSKRHLLAHFSTVGQQHPTPTCRAEILYQRPASCKQHFTVALLSTAATRASRSRTCTRQMCVQYKEAPDDRQQLFKKKIILLV